MTMFPQRDGRWVLANDVTVNAASVRLTTSRAGGPGGQHVNTTCSKVTLHCPIAALVGLDEGGRARLRTLAGRRLSQADELVLSCDTSRDQGKNREAVLQRLAELVRQAAVRPRKRRPTRPSRASVERRLTSKKQRSDTKQRRRERYDD